MSLLAIAFSVHAEELVSEGAARPDSVKPIPKLNIRWSCAQCEENPKVAPSLSEVYEQEALSMGLPISPDEIAEVTIVDYRQRNPANRIMFGFMAGKDRLGVQIRYRGQVLNASDYSANIVEGMNALCESVAKKSLKQILVVQGSASSSISNADAVPIGSSN